MGFLISLVLGLVGLVGMGHNGFGFPWSYFLYVYWVL